MNTPCNPETIHEIVERLVSGGALSSGGRQVALLRYLINEELAGRGEHLKAYSIGTEVLGRGASFDPAQDAIVRVEVGRLRKALGLYFATTGSNEPIAIVIDKGTYRPRFTSPEAAQAPVSDISGVEKVPPARPLVKLVMAALLLAITLNLSWLGYLFFRTDSNDPRSINTPLVVIQAAEVAGTGEYLETLRYALQAGLTQELQSFSWLTVKLADSTTDTSGRQPLFFLRPYIATIGDRFLLTAILTRGPGQNIVWTSRYEGDFDQTNPAALQRFIAAELVHDLGALNGPITESIAAESEITSPNADTPFRCTINTRRYLRFNTRKQFADAKACLQQLLAQNPTLLELRAMLVYLLAEEAIYPHLSPLPITVRGVQVTERAQRREALLREAELTLDAAAVGDRFALAARMTLAACRDDDKFVRENLITLRALQSNSPDAHVALGLLAGPFLGEWGMAISAEARAFSLKSNPLPWYQFISAVKAGVDDDSALALRMLTRVPMHENAIGQTMIAAFGAEAGAMVRVGAAQTVLSRLGYRTINALEALVEDSCYSRAAKNRIKRGLFALAASAPP